MPRQAPSSSPTRRTREESRQETRRRLLGAAWDVFAERGFAAAAVEEIAARAGFTRGAVYSNFADKDEMFLALMDERLEGRVADISRVMAASSPLGVFADLRTWNDGVDNDPAWLPLMAEFRAHALRNEAARARLADRERTVRALYTKAIQAQFDAAGVTPPAPVADMAIVLQALDHWVPVQEALDPGDMREGLVYDVLATLFDAAIALAERNRD